MEFSDIKELITWGIGLLATTVISLVLGVISIIRSGKLAPREIKGADLNNKSKEISIAEQYDILATKAAEKVLKMQERLDKIEEDSETLELGFVNLKKEYEDLKEQVEVQEGIISSQALIIEEQSKRLDLQEDKIKEQQEEITLLRCELENSRKHNLALMEQMRKESVRPVEISSIETEDCEKLKTKRKTKKAVKNGN